MTESEWPNEAVFREWAERNNASVVDRREHGHPLVATWGDGKEVHLHDDGSITMRAFRHAGGANANDTVYLRGDRLYVDAPGKHGPNARIAHDSFNLRL